LNQLLGSLDATVRKLLTVTTFDFVLEIDTHGNPEHREAMTMAQYFDRLAQQWSEKPSGKNGETNGAALLRKNEEYGEKLAELREEFLSLMDEKQVREYFPGQIPII
jgi:hypothetical protein